TVIYTLSLHDALPIYVIKVQAGGRLVENVENAGIVGLREVRRKFQPLRFAAGKRGGGLSKPQIAEADFVENAQLGHNLWNVDKERQRFAHGKLKHFVNIFPVIMHF